MTIGLCEGNSGMPESIDPAASLLASSEVWLQIVLDEENQWQPLATKEEDHG